MKIIYETVPKRKKYFLMKLIFFKFSHNTMSSIYVNQYASINLILTMFTSLNPILTLFTSINSILTLHYCRHKSHTGTILILESYIDIICLF